MLDDGCCSNAHEEGLIDAFPGRFTRATIGDCESYCACSPCGDLMTAHSATETGLWHLCAVGRTLTLNCGCEPCSLIPNTCQEKRPLELLVAAVLTQASLMFLSAATYVRRPLGWDTDCGAATDPYLRELEESGRAGHYRLYSIPN